MFGVRRQNRGGHFLLENVERPLTRVELHVHVDGSVRHETLYEIAKEKKIDLPGRGTFEEMVDYLVVKKVSDLTGFLQRFHLIIPCLRGDLKALERMAYEFVEDCSIQGIIYAEARFCPHILFPLEVTEREKNPEIDNSDETKKWVWDVTGAMIKGLQRGLEDFKSHVNLIATSIRGSNPAWYKETLELLVDKEFHGGWLVGIDIAALPDPKTACEKQMMDKEVVELFQSATKHGIHRTVHAGESGGAGQVVSALDALNAERIGHGYRTVDDASVYERVQKEQVHLECCPWSSVLTGAVSLNEHPHPIVQFFQDGFNVSVNTDDPTITGTRMDDEYSLLNNWGLCEAHFVRGNFNAARSCFLPEERKKDLIQTISRNYGTFLE